MDGSGQEFEIIVSTSGRFAAGTDAKVFIQLFGTDGESEEIELRDDSKAHSRFEAGSTDRFKVMIKDRIIGTISKINIRHDDSGCFSGWYLNKIKIIDKTRDRDYQFTCNRWLAKDEADKKISLELENKTLPIVKIDQLEEKNRPLHNTIKFTSNQFIVRRGQSIFLDIHLARPFNEQTDLFYITLKSGKKPREHDKSFVHLKRVNEFDATREVWAYKIIGIEKNIIHLEVNCPASAMVAKYEMTIEDDDDEIYKNEHPLVVLFNPWNLVDDVYMKNEEWCKEYVLRQHGVIFTGSSKYQHPMNWYFGQFEEVSLDCVFELLEGTKAKGRDSPIEVARRLSSLVNSCDNRGLLVGNWSGSYEGGECPTYWTSSPAIFEKYMETKHSVKFGQCWVFSALLTSLLRCIGVPCRSVTNFNSAHDTNENISKDIYLDEDGEQIKTLSSDSIWNFHCWNDAWMARPDLKLGYGGWQAVDATPQESSGGLYQCGPCSLQAIKEGDVDFPYDGKFLLAEVNSDIFFYKKNDDGEWKVVQTNRTHVGKKISTKCLGTNGRQDITDDYKFKEMSALERASVRKAMNRAGNIAISCTPKTVEMKMRPEENVIEIGKDIEVNVFLKNTAEKSLSLLLTIGGNVIRYNGVSTGNIDSQKLRERISGQDEKRVVVTMKSKDYMEHLHEYTSVRLFVTCTVKETKQVCTANKIVQIRRPELRFLNAEKALKYGKKKTLEIELKNPLKIKLTGCKLHLDGTLMKERIALPLSDIEDDELATFQVTICPNTKIGVKSLLATFNCRQLAYINSSVKLEVVP